MRFKCKHCSYHPCALVFDCDPSKENTLWTIEYKVKCMGCGTIDSFLGASGEMYQGQMLKELILSEDKLKKFMRSLAENQPEFLRSLGISDTELKN